MKIKEITFTISINMLQDCNPVFGIPSSKPVKGGRGGMDCCSSVRNGTRLARAYTMYRYRLTAQNAGTLLE